jgi:ParB-like nuclease family protein
MPPTLAAIDFSQLSEEARWTLDNITALVNDDIPEREIADLLGLELAEVQRRRDELAAEMTALAGGPTVPAMSADEFEGLVASIEEYGQLIPIYTDARGLGGIIDGRNRRRACAKLRIEPRWEQIVDEVLEDDELQRLALVVNVARRQLPAGARRGFVQAELKRDASRSDRAIAAACGASQPFVGKVRRDLERAGQLKTAISRVGIDGVERRVGDRARPAPALQPMPQSSATSVTVPLGEGVLALVPPGIAEDLLRGWSPAVQIRLEPTGEGSYRLAVRRAVSL